MSINSLRSSFCLSKSRIHSYLPLSRYSSGITLSVPARMGHATPLTESGMPFLALDFNFECFLPSFFRGSNMSNHFVQRLRSISGSAC